MPSRKAKTIWILVVGIFFGGVIHHVHGWFETPAPIKKQKLVQQPKPRYVAPPVQLNRNVTVQLTTATTDRNPFLFYPANTSVTVHPGQVKTVYFYVKNPSNITEEFHIIPHVAPANMVPYLARTKGFSLKKFVIQPQQTIKLPLTFFVDTHLPPGATVLTLNYTLFPGKVISNKVVK